MRARFEAERAIAVGTSQRRCGSWTMNLSKFVSANRRASHRLARHYGHFFGHSPYHAELMGRIGSDLERVPEAVLEAGGIDRPMLGRGRGYRYDGVDIDEKGECDSIYDRFWVQSIEKPVPGKYDMVVSMTLLEHVPDNTAAAKSIFESLIPGGTTHHYLPSRGHPYALILRLVGPKWQKRLLATLRSEEHAAVSGYPTFFDGCSVSAMRRIFEEAGFEDIDIRTYYRANDYFAFLVPAFVLVTAIENLCRKARWTYFASGFVISARKPSDAT